MWTRQDVKFKGKNAFKANYWMCVLVAVVIGVAGGASGGATGGVTGSSGGMLGALREISGSTGIDLPSVIAIFIGIAGFAIVISALVSIFVKAPLDMGCRSFYLENTYQPASIREIGRGFTQNYLSNVGTLFLRSLFVGIGTMLFVIPGIYLGQCYRLVPYVLADNPGMTAMEALSESKRLMNGHKWNAFVLDLSFIGWYLLSLLTAGILLIFWVNPYVYSTDAVLYRVVSQR